MAIGTPANRQRWLVEDALTGVDATEDRSQNHHLFMQRDDVEFASVEIDDLMAAFGKALIGKSLLVDPTRGIYLITREPKRAFETRSGGSGREPVTDGWLLAAPSKTFKRRGASASTCRANKNGNIVAGESRTCGEFRIWASY